MLASMHQKYVVVLTEDERKQLEQLLAAGTAPARKLAHARVLLKADKGPGGPGWVDAAIAEAVEVSQPTISRIRQQFVEAGVEAALKRPAPRRGYTRTLGGAQGTRLIAPTCRRPPGNGRAACMGKVEVLGGG